MSTGNDSADIMLIDVIGEHPSRVTAHRIAQAVGVPAQSLCAVRLGGISADQLRALCVTLQRSADEILGTGMGCTDSDEREILRLWRGTDKRGRSLILHVAQGQQGWSEGNAFRVIEGARATE